MNLDDHLLDAYTEPDPVQVETGGYRLDLDDPSHAVWAGRKLRFYENDVTRKEQIAAQEKARIDAWLAEATAASRGKAQWFRLLLIDLRHRLEARDPNLAKTYRLPGVSLLRRAARAKAVLVDEEAFVLWALDADHSALRIEPRVSTVKGLGYATTEDGSVVRVDSGDLVPGVRIVTGGDSYDVRLDDGTDDE